MSDVLLYINNLENVFEICLFAVSKQTKVCVATMYNQFIKSNRYFLWYYHMFEKINFILQGSCNNEKI